MLIKGYVIKNGKFIKNGEITLIDFGLAQLYINSKNFNNYNISVGKKGYQSPEVYQKQKFNSAKADVWSLGCILFIMTFGCLPYKIPTINDPMFKFIINGKFKQLCNQLNKKKYVSLSLIS